MAKRSWSAAGAVVASLAFAAAAVAAPVGKPDRVSYRTGSFVVNCTSTGQICEPARELQVRVRKGEVRIERLRYKAVATHCSPGRILISLDGKSVGRTDFVNAGERATVDKLRLRLDPGRHTFAFRIEGKIGGCNVGSVGSWGGKIRLTGTR